MNKLKPNMYVRTDEGIRKIIEEFDEGYELNRSLHYLYPEGHDLYKEDLEELDIKASFNIIDLIEVGDYVNGRKVYQVGYNFQDNYVLKMSESNYEDFIYPNEIKSVLTKEQFFSMEYKLGDK